MSTDNWKHPDPAIDAFLDGTLPPHEHARMLLRIETDAKLKAECERQAELDASLARLFTPPPVPAIAVRDQKAPDSRASRPPRPAKPRRSLRLAAIAAILLIGFAYAARTLINYLVPAGPSPYSPNAYHARHNPTSFVAEYHALVEGGFKPDWTCETQTQFAHTFQSRLGQPLLFDPDAPAITMVGLSYANVLSDRTIVFLGMVHGHQVLIFADRLQNDKPHTLPSGSGLHLFRGQLGGLVLYELTPLNQSMLLGRFRQPADGCQ
jgi:hypothetical protein